MLKKRSGFYYSNSIWLSPAYQRLTISARNLLHFFICELRYSTMKRKDGYDKVWTNNGEVSCTESQFRKETGVTSSTYLSARNLLIETGFISQTYRGGMGNGDRSKYFIHVSANGSHSKEERWKKYPDENWKHEIPQMKSQLVGVKTQWKKGITARKL